VNLPLVETSLEPFKEEQTEPGSFHLEVFEVKEFGPWLEARKTEASGASSARDP
jgi:hypothetical protein